ncbi:MAG TPA: hypothetical protein VFC69_04285 [Dysgonamonadaceae bacterium]|nr:hypothetical protein [Dysgonamonadaceae bacterium]
MKNWNHILSKLRTTINRQGIDSFHVLEELVPIEEQMEFFKHLDDLNARKARFVPDSEIEMLFSPDVSIERKKESIVLLSSIPDVKAYRALETYQSNPLEPELKNWSSIALLGSRIGLDTELSGKPQIYISTGLGGHNKKLRFFTLFITQSQETLTDLQKQIVEREFRFQLESADVDIETFEIKDNYFTILFLFPFKTDVRAILQSAIDECNQYGNFLDNKFIFTNVKVFDDEEIQKLLDNDLKME